jgi:F-type H+-transporting ATPase subunit a
MFINSNLNQSNLVINSPLEQFDVINLISLNAPIFGYLNITLTNFALYSIITLFLILALHMFSNNENKLLPSK